MTPEEKQWAEAQGAVYDKWNAEGIVPIVRDNGQQRVIMLTNTGKPEEPGWDKVGDKETYKAIQLEQPVKRDYKLDMSVLQTAPGTRYRDVQTGELFVVNDEEKLVSANNPAYGMDIGLFRCVERLD